MMKKQHFYAAVILFSFLAAGIQPTLATINLTSEGWDDGAEGDPGVGIWDPDTKTATLTTDVSETIIISNPWFEEITENDRITLVGGGHTISGVASGPGVDLAGSLYVIIQNLNVTGCVSGISLNPSGYCKVINNTISDCDYGIYMSTAGTCLIEGNNVSMCDYGILIQSGSIINTLKNNTVENNNVGFSITSNSDDNKIYNNNFITNKMLSSVSGDSGNVFNLALPIGGNYWSDWLGPDEVEPFGIVDEPYVIVPPNVVQDNLPWTVQNGWLPVANAGPYQTVECACQQGGTKVTLDGTGSTGAVNYEWTGNFYENPASGATPTVTLNGCQPEYEFTLVINGGELDTETDTVIITVVDTTPPIISCPGDTTIEAMDPDGVPVPKEDDRIQAFLAGASATDNCDPPEEIIITNDAPAVFYPGDTTVTFTATDELVNTSDTCESTVTVVEAAEGQLRIIPKIINREGRLRKILAVIRFPEGTTEEDIDIGQPLILYPGDSLDGIEATNQRIVTWYRWGTLRVSIFASFSKDEVTAGVPEDGQVEMMVIGRFMDGQYFYGLDTVRIISWDWTWW